MSAGPRSNGAAGDFGEPLEPVPVSPAAENSVRLRLKKTASAFRTISEVADDLHIPQHVLRFWETKFPQVRPLKRGGGRRYYRPDDIALLRRISDLLYIQGFTIKGVQRLLREGGGRLSDDIPPPTGDERQGPDAAAAAASGERLLPGLLDDDPDRRSAQAAEIMRLRQALTEALSGLTALRALLP